MEIIGELRKESDHGNLTAMPDMQKATFPEADGVSVTLWRKFKEGRKVKAYQVFHSLPFTYREADKATRRQVD
jgi:hypothetical protein